MSYSDSRLDNMEHFTDRDFIVEVFLSMPLDEWEKREVRNNKRRKNPFTDEELKEHREIQRECYAEDLYNGRLLLMSALFTNEQIRTFEKDKSDTRSYWKVYDESEVGKAENALAQKMQDEEFKRYLANNPDYEPPPF